MSDHWQSRAACGRSSIDFTAIVSFYDDPQHRRPNPIALQARAICAACPVLTECGTHALTSEERIAGYMAGMTEHERHKWRQRRALRSMRTEAA